MQQIMVDNKKLTPSKIICIGRNYVDHIHELGNEIPEEMVVFLKPNSAISNQLNAIHNDEPLHFEGELCFVYQQGEFSAIGFGLDLTKRTLQTKLKEKGLPWERAKAFDGAAVFSHFVTIENMNNEFCLQLQINNNIQQIGGTLLMMYKPVDILAQLQSFITLEDGDVVMTGTPKGVGKINHGDKYEAKVFRVDKGDQQTVLLSENWLAQ